jgi:AcrR family transcriptional regulator
MLDGMTDSPEPLTPKRRYRMSARADAKAATRERIIDTADAVFLRSPDEGSSLEDVAKGAGTTVQTVLRHFGSRDGLIEAVIRRASEPVRKERAHVPEGDVPAAVHNLVRHYERYGDMVLRLLAIEHRRPILRKATDRGREVHYEWVDNTFAPQLAALRGAARERRRAQLVAVCDVYVWKLLRRDMELGIPQTETAIVELIE